MFYKNYFVILSDATKAIRSPVATKVVKSKCRQKGRMSLATRDDALLPRERKCSPSHLGHQSYQMDQSDEDVPCLKTTSTSTSMVLWVLPRGSVVAKKKEPVGEVE
jgi:hypothetical protein